MKMTRGIVDESSRHRCCDDDDDDGGLKVGVKVHDVDDAVDECDTGGTPVSSKNAPKNRLPLNLPAANVEADCVGVDQIDDPMLYEERRLRTFTNWPKRDVIRPEDLASAGLYYTGQGDRVRCAFCQGILFDWARGDRPMDEHRRVYPGCPFLLEMAFTNVHEPPAPAPAPAPPTPASPLILESQARHPRMALEDARLRSLIRWTGRPQHLRNEDFAGAGFFASDSGSVCCFFCGITLRNWQPEDAPWSEHARWSPNCEYVQYVKGVPFVSMVLENFRGRGLPVGAVEEPARRNPEPARVEPPNPSRSYDVPPDEELATQLRRIAEQSAEPGDLSEEARLLREDRFCKVCIDRERDTVLLPCRHFALCGTCAARCSVCPICMQRVTDKIRTYYS